MVSLETWTQPFSKNFATVSTKSIPITCRTDPPHLIDASLCTFWRKYTYFLISSRHICAETPHSPFLGPFLANASREGITPFRLFRKRRSFDSAQMRNKTLNEKEYCWNSFSSVGNFHKRTFFCFNFILKSRSVIAALCENELNEERFWIEDWHSSVANSERFFFFSSSEFYCILPKFLKATFFRESFWKFHLLPPFPLKSWLLILICTK